MTTPYDVIRAGLQELLSWPLSDHEWKLLVDQGQVEAVLTGMKEIHELAVHSLSQLYGPKNPGELAPPKTSGSTRREVVSVLVADEAAKDEKVLAFRADPANHLANWPLALEELYDWIHTRGREDGSEWGLMGWWMNNVPVPEESMRAMIRARSKEELDGVPPVQIAASEVAKHLEIRWLEYAESEIGIERVTIRAGGVLARLKDLSQYLVGRYGWREEQATLFVLTGRVPLIQLVDVEYRRNEQLPALSRIVMTLDPELSVQEVAEEYAFSRRHILGRRPRELSEKHLELARFSIQYKQSESWAERMQSWNAFWQDTHADWQYTEPTNFARDSTQARRRLLGQRKEQGEDGET